MVVQEVLLRGQQRRGLVLVAALERLGGAVGQNLLEFELESDVILAFLPAFLLVKPGGAVNGEHLVARILHEQALFRGVHAFEGIGGAEGVNAVADEGAHVVDGQVGDGVFPGVGQVARDAQVALVHVGIAGGGGEAHAAQLLEHLFVDFNAEQARQQTVRGGALLVDLDELVHAGHIGRLSVFRHR